MTDIDCALDLRVGPTVIRESPLFRDWVTRNERSGARVERVEVRSAVIEPTTSAITQLDLQATVRDPEGHTKQDSFTLRSDTVDVVALLRDEKDQLHCVFVKQYRLAVGAYVISNVAGGIEPGETPEQAAQREVREEVRRRLPWGLPQPLNRWCCGAPGPFHVSPGSTSENVHYLAIQAQATRAEIEALHGATAGLVAEGEHITVHVVPAAEALTHLSSSGRVDGKAIQGLELARLAGLL
ncbi:MAG TPA: NUDIX hydrolase [Candidatus Saccharimonadia bacterium]|nr:NUDIX hydrolase [Candidatus Saccharimonadia bacterium]